MYKRKYLGMASASTGLAGCVSGSPSGSNSSGGAHSPNATTTPTPTSSPTPSPTPVPGPGDYDAKTVRESATDVAYDTLFRKIEQYKKESVHFEHGQIYQAMYGNDYTYLQLYVTNDSNEWEGDVAATYWGDNRLPRNNAFELWAVVEDLHEYDRVNGDTRTIPLITIVDYELYEN